MEFKFGKLPSYLDPPVPSKKTTQSPHSRERERAREREEMRIADVLRERDDEDDGGISGDNLFSCFTSKSHHASPTNAACSSSRFLLSRWFRNRRKRVPAISDGESGVPRPAAGGIVSGRVDSGSKRFTEMDLSSGIKPNEIAFNLGMGIGMAFLLAGSSNEMNKMAELRKQMESLLKEIKGEVQRRDDSSFYTLSDAGENEVSTAISIEQHFTESDRKNYEPVNSLRAMDELEEELQVELERMERNFEGEDDGKHGMELEGKKVDLSSGSTSAAWYDHMPDENGEEQHGVCAYDLERRLHELLQTRQQERIEALESALKSAQRKLNEKEDELLCWRNNNGGIIPENEENYFSLSFESSQFKEL
ncbi:protein POLAR LOCALIZATION DURING ASYMMETRIC DIVISION AND REDISTRIBUTION-like [Phalaenopsis equestris]|uniref:protein POLAR LOCALIZATION DURING ASYMMETRIC DIVISION AND REDISTRIBUTION-like n=1 Tax=Phalaenopsis equestris TaxID=78828 RepID=UPI0009E4DA30|nr:protein POLAR LOCALIZATION DURING ASYMMETRIC DIVISION AND REDISTRIBUTION-like [Phalaenopsis equestris]